MTESQSLSIASLFCGTTAASSFRAYDALARNINGHGGGDGGQACLVTAAQETSDLATTAIDQGQRGMACTKHIAAVLQQHDGSNGRLLDAHKLIQIRDLIRERKIRTVLETAHQVKNLSIEMNTKVQDMTRTLQETVQEVTGGVAAAGTAQHDLDTDENGMTRGLSDASSAEETIIDPEASVLMELITDVDQGQVVEQVNQQTRGMEEQHGDDAKPYDDGHDDEDDDNDNVITATGNRFAFVAAQQRVSVQIFQEIKSVSDSLVELLALAGGSNNSKDGNVDMMFSACTTCWTMVTSGLETLYKALRLGQVLQRGLNVVQRIVDALIRFFQVSWEGKWFSNIGKRLEKLIMTGGGAGVKMVQQSVVAAGKKVGQRLQQVLG